jgi:EpsI family protein
MALLVGAAGAFAISLQHRPDTLAAPLATIGEEIAGWTHMSSQSPGAGILERMRPTEFLAKTYRKGDRNLSLFIAYYSEQRAGESMHSPRNCLPGSGWEIWKYDSALVAGRERAEKINRFFIQNQGKRMVVYYWYQSPGRIFADEYIGKLMLIRDTLITGRTAGALVRIVVDDVPDIDHQALDFAAGVMPQVTRCFRSETPADPRAIH